MIRIHTGLSNPQKLENVVLKLYMKLSELEFALARLFREISWCYSPKSSALQDNKFKRQIDDVLREFGQMEEPWESVRLVTASVEAHETRSEAYWIKSDPSDPTSEALMALKFDFLKKDRRRPFLSMQIVFDLNGEWRETHFLEKVKKLPAK